MKLDNSSDSRNYIFSEAEAIVIADRVYGLRAQSRSLPGELDFNFHIIAANGEHFVLKVMRADCEPDFVEMQCAALIHLAERAPDLQLPHVRLTATGERMA
jgi:Ser/Thr protein kinase RdoA (MazF antagonist)